MSTKSGVIKSYNNYAVEWTRRLRSGENIAHDYLEKPAMYSKIPHLKGKSVLCLGCGSGEESQHLKLLGAKRVVGIDISSGLISNARRSYPDLEFFVMDMEKLRFPPETFDFVYSSLVLHYAQYPAITLKNVYRSLKKRGYFLVSTHHPVKWGAEVRRDKSTKSTLMGYVKISPEGVRTFGDYHQTRIMHDRWFGKFDVTYYHHSISSMIRAIRKSGFSIEDFDEPKPIPSVKKKDMDFWKIYQKIPMFMIFLLRK